MRRDFRKAMRKKRAVLLLGGLSLAGLAAFGRLREADLRGQVVLITGASRGLGFLMAREFGLHGCRLVICARNSEELERAAQDLSRKGVEVLAVPCDIGDQAQVDHVVAEARRRFGRIDILVNNAGIIQVGPVQTMTTKDFEDALRVMFWGVLYPTLAVLPEMLERGQGRMVNITSIGGKVSVPHLLPYNCAKFAAVGLSEGLRAELSPRGIKVVTIVPGLMRTGSFLNAYFKGEQEREFRWFSLGSTLPLLSMDAERAARQIVSATRKGQPERILSVPANILALFHGMFPGLTADILAWANRLMLPSAQDSKVDQVRGMEVNERAPLIRVLRGMGFSAAERFNQYPGPVPV